MDPDITWNAVKNEGYALAERAEAAVNLLRWLAVGGHPPTMSDDSRQAAIGQCADLCHTVISQMIDAHDDLIDEPEVGVAEVAEWMAGC